jgi:lipid-binding SYLF domain-containing protein
MDLSYSLENEASAAKEFRVVKKKSLDPAVKATLLKKLADKQYVHPWTGLRNSSVIKKLASIFLAGWVAFTAASAATEQEVVNQSSNILRDFYQMPERQIPRRILREAHGLAIIRVLKAGFVVTGKGGEGVVVARNAHGWSGPSFVGLGGAGWGLQIGAQLTDFIFVLNNDAAVRAFSRDGNLKLGADVSAAAGPVGRDLQAGVTPTAAVYTYSRSKGLFAGISLEGAIIGTQKTANERYYGRPVGARAILSGRVAPPSGAQTLLNLLNR